MHAIIALTDGGGATRFSTPIRRGSQKLVCGKLGVVQCATTGLLERAGCRTARGGSDTFDPWVYWCPIKLGVFGVQVVDTEVFEPDRAAAVLGQIDGDAICVGRDGEVGEVRYREDRGDVHGAPA